MLQKYIKSMQSNAFKNSIEEQYSSLANLISVSFHIQQQNAEANIYCNFVYLVTSLPTQTMLDLALVQIKICL